MGKKIAIVVLVLLIIYNLCYIYYMNYVYHEQEVDCVVGYEYVDYDFMLEPSDQLAKSLQEIKFDNLSKN